MHKMKLHVQVLRPAGRRSRAARVEHCHWSEGRHNCVGVSLQEIRATMQVMLGESLRARCDATLVYNMCMSLCMCACVRASVRV